MEGVSCVASSTYVRSIKACMTVHLERGKEEEEGDLENVPEEKKKEELS